MPIERELSLRAVLTGMLLGIVLTPSNVYAGLKIGWSFNMSIIALLVGFGFWHGLLGRRAGARDWTLHESNINQTVASAAASIVSGGLVAPIPAYTLLTGEALPPASMIAWVFSVSFLGIWIAWYLRPSLIADAGLAFPEGMATLEALTQVYGQGREATQRLAALFGAAVLSATVKWVDEFRIALPRWSPDPRLERLTFNVDPSLLLLGFGAIVGLRVGLSLLLGAVLAWGVLAPWLIAQGLVELPGGSRGPQFAALVEFLLWPGVSLMVCATLSSLALRAWRHRAVRRPARGASSALGASPARAASSGRGPARMAAIGLLVAAAGVVALQVTLFGIHPAMALLTLPLAVCLAAVAARVVGATGIPPIGAIGQLSQMSFGALAPGQVALNLISANTAGGAAGQCTDLMNDFKVGERIGATPSRQVIAQCVGILVGSVVGVLAYRALIPDPRAMLLTAEWPAPAVATWAAVARTLDTGLDAVSTSVRWAMAAGGIVGLVLGALDALLPARRAARLPSAAALGLAFVLPASASLTMALGAILAWAFVRVRPGAGERLTVAVAAGLIAGESMLGVGASFWRLARGG